MTSTILKRNDMFVEFWLLLGGRHTLLYFEICEHGSLKINDFLEVLESGNKIFS